MWRSADDSQSSSEESSGGEDEGEDDSYDDYDAAEEDDFDDDHYRAGFEQAGSGEPASPAPSTAPLTVLSRDLKVAGAPVHIRVWQRGDHWGSPGARYIGEDRGDRWWASVSFNPSRLRDPKGWQLCPAAEARTWACALLVLLARAGVVVPQCEHINGLTAEHEDVGLVFDARTGAAKGEHREATGQWWCEDFRRLEAAVTVSRVDASMDFTGVQDTSTLVDVFMGHRQPRAGKSKRRYTPFSASALAGKTGHRVAVYDKFIQSRKPGRPRTAWAPKGTVRVEVRARARKLQKTMLPTHLRGVEGLQHYSRCLGDLTPEFLTEMFMEGFVWAGFDRWYGGQRPLQATRGLELNSTTAQRLVEFLDERAAGRPSKEVVDNTTRRYEQLAKQWGYIVGVPRRRNRGPLRHLDVVSSTETQPSLEWRLQKGLVGANGGAAVSVVRRRPRPPEWERPPRRRPVLRSRAAG